MWRKGTRFFVKSCIFARKIEQSMIEATRMEAAELYVLFTLLEQGTIALGTASGGRSGEVPVALVRRMEHDGERFYVIEGDTVRVRGEGMDTTFPREDFGAAARIILQRLAGGGREVDLSDIEGFLDAVRIFDLHALTDDTTVLHLALYSSAGPLVGVRLQSALCGMRPLLDGGRTANIKYEQTGIRFSAPAVQNINRCDDGDDTAAVARRILYMQGQGAVLRYCDVADRVFRSNLLMLDTNMPRIVASMLITLHLDGVTRMAPHVELLRERNPLKLKDELVTKHGFYAHKVRSLLLAAAWGMRPAKIYRGEQGAVGAYIMTDANGGMALYTRADEQTFGDFLFASARLEKALPSDAKYGLLERENGTYYLKLNLKIGLK